MLFVHILNLFQENTNHAIKIIAFTNIMRKISKLEETEAHQGAMITQREAVSGL